MDLRHIAESIGVEQTNPISSFWLSKRHEKSARLVLSNAAVLDIGSRREKITSGAISLDIDRSVHPDICASAEFLPFRSRTFDYISMLEVIEHLENEQLDHALLECQRVCHKLVVSTPNCDSKVWDRIVWPVWSHTVGRGWLGAHKQFFGKKSLEDLLEKGFRMKILVRDYSRWNLLLLIETRPAHREIADRKEVEVGPEVV